MLSHVQVRMTHRTVLPQLKQNQFTKAAGKEGKQSLNKHGL